MVFCAVLDFYLDLYIPAGSHGNIMCHRRTEIEMILWSFLCWTGKSCLLARVSARRRGDKRGLTPV